MPRTLRSVLKAALASIVGVISGAGTRSMALDGTVLRASFASEAVQEPVKYEVFLPAGHANGANLPHILFLPGYKDDGTFCRRKGFFEIADRLIREKTIPPLAVVCSNRGTGIWVDEFAPRRKYETALVEDLLERLHRVHGFPNDAAARGIHGISIGGYAAIKIPLRHPGVFRTSSAFSPALDPNSEQRVRAGNPPWEIKNERARSQAYGPKFDVERSLREDPFWLVKNASGPIGVHFYLSCGREDRHGLARPLEAFRALLEERGVWPGGSIQPGNHNVSYWKGAFPSVLAFHARYLRAGPGMNPDESDAGADGMAASEAQTGRLVPKR